MLFYHKIGKYLLMVPLIMGLAVWYSWDASPATLLSNICFLIGIWFLVCGLWKLANNLGLFHSVRYGFKRFFHIIRGCISFSEKPSKMGDYFYYLREFVPDDIYPVLLVIAGSMLAAALIFCFFSF